MIYSASTKPYQIVLHGFRPEPLGSTYEQDGKTYKLVENNQVNQLVYDEVNPVEPTEYIQRCLKAVREVDIMDDAALQVVLDAIYADGFSDGANDA